MSYIAIINLQVNNLKSIVGAINYLGFKTKITKSKNVISNSSGIILPGVGSYPEGMKKLKKFGLDNTIRNYFTKGKPILAICLGFQMLFSSSTEFKNTKGLNLINGEVKSLKILKTKQVLPNIGWRKLQIKKINNNKLFQKLRINPVVYFIHSYYVELKNKKLITSYINFGDKKIVSSIQYKNLYGVQFHPEKSCKIGLDILKNFLNQAKSYSL